jgi:chaperonin GroES
MNIRPLRENLIIRQEPDSTTSAGGIVLPGAVSDKPATGEVLAAGPGRYVSTGAVVALGVNVGDRVMFTKFVGTEVTIDGEQLIVISEDDIIAIVS